MSSLYAYIPDGAEWEDMILFSSLDDAKKYAIQKFSNNVRYGMLKKSGLDNFHIEEYKSRMEGGHSVSYLSIRLIVPSEPLDVIDMWNDVMNQEIDINTLFRVL